VRSPRPVSLMAALAVCLLYRSASGSEAPPRYEPGVRVSGTVRVWGNERMQALTRLWREGFERLQPGVRVLPRLLGTGTAMAGLYGGVAEVAFLGREATAKELMAFEWVFRYKPMRVELATGSLGTPGRSAALVAFVHKDNPLSRITLAEFDAVFGYERKRGSAVLRTWDQLGLQGEWAGRPIHAYGYDVETGSGAFFRSAVLENSYKLNWERVTEFRDRRAPDGSLEEADRRVLAALGADRYGIAVSVLGCANPYVRPLVLGLGRDGPWVEASRDSLISRRYPLTRALLAFINRRPGEPPAPAIAEFLRYVLSQQGQDDVAREGSFLPLNPDSVREQRKKLE